MQHASIFPSCNLLKTEQIPQILGKPSTGPQPSPPSSCPAPSALLMSVSYIEDVIHRGHHPSGFKLTLYQGSVWDLGGFQIDGAYHMLLNLSCRRRQLTIPLQPGSEAGGLINRSAKR